jgi:hypothetical protein
MNLPMALEAACNLHSLIKPGARARVIVVLAKGPKSQFTTPFIRTYLPRIGLQLGLHVRFPKFTLSETLHLRHNFAELRKVG